MKPGEYVCLAAKPDGTRGEILRVGVEPGDLGPELNESTEVVVYWGTSDGVPVIRVHTLSELTLGPVNPYLDDPEWEPAFVRLGYGTKGLVTPDAPT